MYYETNCTAITSEKWDELMDGSKPCSRKIAIKAAIETGVISDSEGKKELKMPYYNPYSHYKTKTHIIYVNSAIEYFIRINN
jgi:hypothetical protein